MTRAGVIGLDVMYMLYPLIFYLPSHLAIIDIET